MCERVEKGATVRVRRSTVAPVRQPIREVNRSASQPQRLDSVVRRVLKGLLRQRRVSDDDHGIVTGL